MHWRALLFCGLAGLMLGGPTSVQVFGFDPQPSTRPWRMYSRVGLEVCVVRYQDAAGRPLDRVELLELKNPAPARRRLLKTVLDVREEASRICRKHEDLDLRATVDCSTPPGFARAIEPSEALCPGS